MNGEPDVPPAWEWPEAFARDAHLHDVCFVDRDYGWAVGDRGTVLHTRDGGQSWLRQATPTTGRLEAIQFVNRTHGWAVGGRTVRITKRPVGILLRTVDGGKTWELTQGNFLPWLQELSFQNAQTGYVFGAASPMFPSGVFKTEDGGRHWSSLTTQTSGWVTGHIDRRGSGLLLDRRGLLTRLTQESAEPLGRIDGVTSQPNQLHRANDGTWLLCGNQGLLRTAVESDPTWSAPLRLPSSCDVREFDFLAADAVDSYRWIAGAPGSFVFFSADAGRSWSALPTGHHLPIHGIDFVDRHHGWIVGAMGTIMATTDGGKTWQYQQGRERRLAVMGIFGHPSQIPWPVVVQLAANEGYYLGLEVLADATTTEEGLSIRLHEATIAAGGTSSHLVPAPLTPAPRMTFSETQLQAAWTADSESAYDQLVAYFVRQIRINRPDLIVLAEPDETDGLARLTQRLVIQATELAADSDRYRSQLDAGLTAWRVAQVTTLSTVPSQAGYIVSGSRLVTPLGASVAQIAERAASFVETPPTTMQDSESNLVIRTLDGPNERLFSKPNRANQTRRPSGPPTDIGQQNDDYKRQRNVATILRGARAGQPGIWQQTLHLASQLPINPRVEVYLSAAQHDLQLGNYSAAYELLGRIHQEAPVHELAEAARLEALWLLTSAEVARHWQPTQTQPVAQRHNQAGEFTIDGGDVRPATFLDQVDEATPMRETNRVVPSRTLLSQRQAEALVEAIQTQQPDLYFDGRLRFPLAAYQARHGELKQARRFWLSQLSGQTPPSLRSLAASELALIEKNRVNPRREWTCVRVKQAPHLDGQFDDAMWNETKPQTLSATLTERGTTSVRLAYDPEFLYVAAECQFHPEATYTVTDEPRQRDQPLSEDRLELFFDVDRDTVTYWRMVIDHRGWAAESLNQDASWNPKWYIARQADETSWRVEAAIPLTELSVDPVMPSTAWAIGLQRIIPGKEWETWVQPGPVEERPEEFGLLLFQ